MCLVVYGVQRYEKVDEMLQKKKVLIKRDYRGNNQNEHKNPTDPLHYFSSSINNKAEIHLKYRLATTLTKSKFDIFDTDKEHSFSFL